MSPDPRVEQGQYFLLNEQKNEQDWAPYSPFTLLIADPEHLWSFIQGDLYLLTVVDWGVLRDLVQAQGFEADLDMENTSYPLGVKFPDGSIMRISSHLVARAGIECVSLKWIVMHSIEDWKRMSSELDLADVPASAFVDPNSMQGFSF